MTIEYAVRCDGCGRILATSRLSARAARAEAVMKRQANHGPDGDHCVDCRKKQTKVLSEEARALAASRAHSIGVRKP